MVRQQLQARTQSVDCRQGRSEEIKKGGVVSHSPTTFQSLINIFSPKIVSGEGIGGGCKISSGHTKSFPVFRTNENSVSGRIIIC
jgi:hypothetical protein